MSDFHEIVEIDGKGFGCIAKTKIKPGTLIFSETPAVSTTGDYPGTIDIKTLMLSFKNLTQKDQNEYLDLHNNNAVDKRLFDKIVPEDVYDEMNLEETENCSALMLKILGIYNTNTYGDGVGIKMAR